MKTFLNVLYFIGFVLIFYMENFFVGSLQLTYVWKFPLLIYLIFQVVGRKVEHTLILLGYLFAFKTLLNTSFFDHPLESFIIFSKYLVIPLFVHWIYLNVNSLKSLALLRQAPVLLSLFFILANIPFYLGLFPGPVNAPLLYYGDEVLSGFVGILGAPHYTSSVLAVTSIILMDYLLKTKLSVGHKILITVILLAGLFLLLKTFARTGWLMFIVGFVLIIFRRIPRRNLMRIILLFSLVLVGLFFLFQNNESFRRRIMDERSGQEELTRSERIGSGRIQIAQVYLTNLYESDLATYLIGMGSEESMRRYEKKKGVPLIAHNGIIQILVDDGLIGILLYMAFLFAMFKAISRSSSSCNRRTYAVFFMFISCLVTQQANYFLLDVFLAMNVAIVLHEDRINEVLTVKKMLVHLN